MRSVPPALRTFLTAYDPAIARLFFAARTAVLTAAPNANELIYDAYNTVSAVYTFSGRLTEAFCHVAAYGNYVNLGFNRGAELPDPAGLLVGSGSTIRHVRISAVRETDRAEIRRLLRAAVAQGLRLAPAPATPRSVIKATSGKKRRRPRGAT